MIDSEKLKKKICDIVAPYVSARGDNERIADALIAAGIGDVKHERFVFKKAYMDFFIRFNNDKEFRNDFYNVTLGCQIRKFEDMMEQIENELVEERK